MRTNGAWDRTCYNWRDAMRSCQTTIQGFHPLTQVMEYEDQQCLGAYLLELKRHNEKLLERGYKEVTVDRAIAISSAHKHQHCGLRSCHPCYQQIKDIIFHNCRCFLASDISILDQPTLEFFGRLKLQSISLEKLTCIHNGILCQSYFYLLIYLVTLFWFSVPKDNSFKMKLLLML